MTLIKTFILKKLMETKKRLDTQPISDLMDLAICNLKSIKNHKSRNMKMEVTRIERQILMLRRLKIPHKQMAADTGIGVNVVTRYFNDAITNRLTENEHAKTIDAYISAQKRVNPEIQGGGE